MSYKLGGTVNATVEVNNVLVNTNIHNVFGVIKGFVDPGRSPKERALSSLVHAVLRCIRPRNVGVCVCETADSYVVLGAHRDAWGPGYARASVGTSILLELAKVVHDMVENGERLDHWLRFLEHMTWSET